ncbi:MAG: OmpA family protein [Sedimentisphaerales bacterium]|nr:OmpA family protein [Sedimentisphaerales bacterium]
MRSVKFSTVLIVLAVCLGMAFVNGCSSEMQDLRLQNRTQQDRIDQLESELRAARLQLDQLKRRLAAAEQTGDVEVDTLRQKIAALEEDLTKKEELIKSMQEKLLGISPLPVELSTALEDFANQNEMVEYDSERGLVKFKSDLLFERGSDQVTTSAAEAVRTLCGILNSDTAKEFDIIVAGHTDDMRIARPATRAAHPTNRHLSSHRAISVVNLMESSGLEAKRLSTRGFGEYRPVAPNAPGKKGNPKNRRVEIFVVPSGV